MTFRTKQLNARQSVNHGKWCASTGDGFNYLHTDGVVRFSTMSNGNWTGFFLTEAEAKAAIDAYQEKQKVTK
jgi:hypothetical protein